MDDKDYKSTPIEITCGDLKIVLIADEKMTAASSSDIHMHSFWELFYLQEGKATIMTETERHELSDGDILLTPPRVYHHTDITPDSLKKSILFAFEKVKPSDDERLFEKVQSVFSGYGFCKLGNGEYIGMLMDAILNLNKSDRIATRHRVRAIATEIVFRLYDMLSEKHADLGEDISDQNNYWEYRYAIDRLLDIYYVKNISLTFLSEKLSVSPQNVSKIISCAYGKSFNELKLELKMRNAKRMLRQTDLSIGEICEHIGYTTQRGFLSAFLKYEGCTPSEYRKNANKP